MLPKESEVPLGRWEDQRDEKTEKLDGLLRQLIRDGAHGFEERMFC